MSQLTIPAGLQGRELLKFVHTNKHILIEEKKAALKFADGIMNSTAGLCLNREGNIVKAINQKAENPTTMDVSVVINTTNWLDSHGDVHVNGLWKKSISESRRTLLLQEHKLAFDHIISDEVKAFTKKMNWKALGVDVEGSTEALVFDATLQQKRNPFMFNQYKEGWVNNHSVGMRYTKIDMAINMDEEDDDARYYKDEIATWKDVYPLIANKEEADGRMYFWVIREAKHVEGSAVPIGSNIVTPTLEVKFDTLEPSAKHTPEPSEKKEIFDWREAINKTTILKF